MKHRMMMMVVLVEKPCAVGNNSRVCAAAWLRFGGVEDSDVWRAID